jgi:hypothetical protein
MAVGAWTFYNEFKKYLGSGDAQMDAQFRITLHTSASTAATATLSVISQVDNEIADGNGYSTSGKALTETWGTGASASEFRFDCRDLDRIWRQHRQHQICGDLAIGRVCRCAETGLLQPAFDIAVYRDDRQHPNNHAERKRDLRA